VLEAEGIAFEEPALDLVAKAAAGSVRDSLSLLDQAIAHGGGKVARASVADMLGSLGADLVWPILERIADGDGAGTVAEAERIAGRSVSFDSALEELASILHRIALFQAGADTPDEQDRERVRAMASRLDAARVQVMYQIALLARRDLPLAPDEYAGFTMALLRMLSFGPREVMAQPARAVPAIEKAPAPAVEKAPRESAPAQKTAFDGDWPAFVAKLNLTGMAGMLARHGEFASFENGRLELVVPEAQRMYADRPYTEKLQAELAPHLGKVRVVVRVGATAGASLAAVRQRESDERRESAAQALEGDPFVRELVRDFGAEIVSSSIKPTDGSRDNSSGRKG